MAMVRNFVFAQMSTALSLIGAGLLIFGSATTMHAQALSRIAGPVNESALTTLPGGVHPWARPQFDRGPAPESLNGHMLVVLKRSPEQEAALQAFLTSQQDPSSPNYHKWLTPEDFGKRFGVADSDVQTVASYLSSQGMRVGRVYGNRMAIEVSATAGQIGAAFHTEVHAYSVAGKTYYANNSSPKIPVALSNVVSGFSSLNNFHVAGGSGAGTQATLDPKTHTLKPLYTITSTTPNTYGISPADLAVIYGIPAPTAQGLGGKNVNIGIVGDSDINVAYVNNYRTIFGLGAKTPTIIVDGNDPGVNGDAYIAYKQIELVSAVAPNANIYYYTSATTDYDNGIYFALLRAVEDNQVQIVLNGFQECESALGSDTMAFINSVSEEAAALGMTFVAASGNSGSAGCAVPGTSGSIASPALAVNGFASSPFVTAVGGTDFYYGTTAMSSYWSTTNSSSTSATPFLSVNTNTNAAKPPVGLFANNTFQEQVWNDSYSGNGNSNAVTNASSVQMASGGGPSTAGSVNAQTGAVIPQPQPWYQTGKVNGISSTARVIPDVSFFAGSGANNTEGYNNTAYLFCMQFSDCQSGSTTFTYSGGTEASSAIFAGAVALAVEQYNSGSRFGLGNVNPTLYSLLGTSAITTKDTTIGTNELACSSGTSCTGGHMSGYAAGTGYDAATGLGSFNITTFVTKYSAPNTTASSVSLSVLDNNGNAIPTCTVNGVTSHCIQHSTWVKFVVSTTPSAATGDVGIFTSSPLQSEAAVETFTLSGGTASGTWNLLPGGTYNIYARYAGDSKYAPSVTATPFTITVSPENCQMVLYGHDVNVGSNTNVPYGTPVDITVEPYSASNVNNVAIPSGSINIYDSYNGGASTLITTQPMNSQGATTFSSNLLAYGQHSITLTYPGNASFNSCSIGPFLANVTKASTSLVITPPAPDATQGNVTLTATVQSATLPSNGNPPTGTITFNAVGTLPNGQSNKVTLIKGFDPYGNAISAATLTVNASNVPSNGVITAVYSGDTNYSAQTTSTNVNTTSAIFDDNYSSATTVSISDSEGISATKPNGPFPATDSLTLTINVSTPGNTPNQECFNIPIIGQICSTVPTISVYANGILLTNSIALNANGVETYTIPQQNGYLNLSSGQVVFDVIYSGYQWDILFNDYQVNASSAQQTITVSDDRTSADFSILSDTTVNQGSPLLASAGVTQATYNLRITSIYNFMSAYSSTPINLSCSIVGYSLAGVRSAPPAGLACGFNSALSQTTASVTLGSGYATQTLYVGAASGYAVASNTAPGAQPASRWWIAGGGTTLACVFLLGLPARRRKWQSLLGACVLVIAAGFGMTGCGVTAAAGPDQQGYNSLNGKSPTSQTGGTPVPAGTYTVLVTATTTANTTITHTLPVQVLVGSTN